MTVEKSLDLQPLNDILSEMPNMQSDGLIPLLQRIQQEYGYLPADVLFQASELTGIPASRFYGVATFYEQFHLEPRGRHTIKCCRGTACHVKGAQRIAETICEQLGIEDGGTTEDLRFTFESVACLGTCFLAPVIMVDNDYYGHLKPEQIKPILERYD